MSDTLSGGGSLARGGGGGRAYRQRDRHLALRDGVHGGAHERRLEHDVARDLALRADLLRAEVNLAGKVEEVVVREPAVHAGVHQVLDGEPVRAFVALQDLDGVRGVEQGVGVGGHGGGGGQKIARLRFFRAAALEANFERSSHFERSNISPERLRFVLRDPILGLGLRHHLTGYGMFTSWQWHA